MKNDIKDLKIGNWIKVNDNPFIIKTKSQAEYWNEIGGFEVVKRDKNQILLFDYTNNRGEVSERSVIPNEIFFESLDCHSEKQWILQAFCLDCLEYRDFYMRNMNASVIYNRKP